MAEIGIAVASKVAEYSVAPIAREVGYIWNYMSSFHNLETQLRKLQVRKETVQQSAVEATRQGDEIFQSVQNWLDRVQNIIDEASMVVQENEQANFKCFMGWCPNLKKRYRHSRKATNKVEAVARLYEEGKFDRISYRSIPKETWIPSYKGYVAFKSRMSTLEDLLNGLRNPDVNMVGIYGPGGIGKTMLARAVAKHAEDKKLYDVVAFGEVTEKPNIKEIQQEIADKLGLTFREESTSGRARILQERLKQEKKVLLVLDNIWEGLILEEVGIPFDNDHMGCKLLLTARSLDVLSEMDSQTNFQIDVLDKGEAWSLFRKNAGACIENDDHLRALAIKVAEACGGLPIAITSVAVALKNKEKFEWENALQELTTPSLRNFEGVAASTYSCIEFSYKQLKDEELKSTFLLCSTMGYSLVGNLLTYGIGLGMFKSVETIEQARNRVNTLVRKLKDSCLLLDTDSYRFSLHDVVRDVGRSIASRDWHMLTITNKVDLRELVHKEVFKSSIRISLHDITELPKELDCPQLQFFYMRNVRDFLIVPDNFFARMPKLKVLHLVGLNLFSAAALHLLVNLQTLYIELCKLRDIDFIGEMKKLEILRIHSSYILELPKETCNLTRLKLLDLNDCSTLRVIPPNVISTLTKLEELYLCSSGSNIKWEVEGLNILDELKDLLHLTTLEISIGDANVLPKGRLLSTKLKRYKIIIGDDYVDHFRWHEISRMVRLNLKTSCCSDSDDDVLHKTRSVKKFLSILDGEGFPELEFLHVQYSTCFRTIVDCLESESCDPFPFLKSLVLEGVYNLEMIYNRQLRTESFHRLRTIEVRRCGKLKNIFSFSTNKALPLLQEVRVFSCHNMEEILSMRMEEDINNNEGIDKIEFKQLRSLSLNSLPKLTSFCSMNNNEDKLDIPTPLFNGKVMLPKLEALELYGINFEKIWHHHQLPGISSCFQCLRQFSIEHCNNLKVLFSSSMVAIFPSLEEIKISGMDDLEMIWPNQLCKDSFRNLKSMEVTWCNKLLTIFQSNMLERIMRLESLIVSDCYLIEEIFDLRGVEFEEESHPETETQTQLRELDIISLPKLKHIWNKDPQKMFYKKLSSVKVCNCKSLKYLFPFSIAQSLSELEQLHVYNCGVEEIVADEGEAKEAVTFVFPRITSLMLNYLPRLETFYRGVHTLQWRNLKKLSMHHCDKAELFASELFN
ncbi:hypothetical protein EZV62_024655 [Acer yangbiense]|uniref:AAA+ ATPase domain-containing protein n=1 Tax=Acer yangbiense TaxID=1000413 RepID=A0A5C7GVT7_9ROSI|nr:hypothetical protein EZV62_024655 [Acer yangbiense]